MSRILVNKEDVQAVVDFLDVVVPENLECIGWHLNGDTELLESFMTDNGLTTDVMNRLQEAIKQPINGVERLLAISEENNND